MDAPQALSALFQQLITSYWDVSRFTDAPFILAGLPVPSTLGGNRFYVEQFQNPGLIGQEGSCFVSDLVVRETDGFYTVTSYVAEIDYVPKTIFGDATYRVPRYFQIYIVFTKAGEIDPDTSIVQLFEDNEQILSDQAPPLPPVPGPVGTVLEIGKWAMQFSDWLDTVLPDDWGALGLVLSPVAELVSQTIASVDDILDGDATLEGILLSTDKVLKATQGEYHYEQRFGYCVRVPWNSEGEEARVFRPMVSVGAASWTLICKVDRVRSLVNDDHVVISVTIDSKQNVVSVMSAWKFVSANPEEGEYNEYSETDSFDCFDHWLAGIGSKFGSGLANDFTYWFVDKYVKPWIAAGNLALQQ